MDKHFVVFLPFFFTLVLARGPHHPRGDRIVKRHVHYRPTKDVNEKLTEDARLLHDKEHIKEHLEEVISKPDVSNMTDEELEFYYFQMHDTDKNTKLDGLEILQAIFHIDQREEDPDHDDHSNDSADFEYYVELIDEVLKEDDIDGDGYLSYSEFVAGRRHKKEQQRKPVVNMLSQKSA